MSLRGDYLGGLPFISKVFDWHPVSVFLFMVFIDFGIINLLMLWEGNFWRERYRSFVINDTISIPFMTAAATVVLRQTGRTNWTPVWWQVLVLVLAFAVSIGLEVDGVRKGVFTMNKELSPSKLYHTIVFGFMGYWMFAPLPVLIRYHNPLWAVGLYAAAIALWVWVVLHDNQPQNAHLEWTWKWRFWQSYATWTPRD